MRDDFEAKNKQLLDEMPRFYHSRLDYFQPSFEALIRAQVRPLPPRPRAGRTLAPLGASAGLGAPPLAGCSAALREDTGAASLPWHCVRRPRLRGSAPLSVRLLRCSGSAPLWDKVPFVERLFPTCGKKTAGRTVSACLGQAGSLRGMLRRPSTEACRATPCPRLPTPVPPLL